MKPNQKLPMPENSTLLYWVDDFDSTSENIKNPVFLQETLNTDFLNALFNALEIDPGADLVKKVIVKGTL